MEAETEMGCAAPSGRAVTYANPGQLMNSCKACIASDGLRIAQSPALTGREVWQHGALACCFGPLCCIWPLSLPHVCVVSGRYVCMGRSRAVSGHCVVYVHCLRCCFGPLCVVHGCYTMSSKSGYSLSRVCLNLSCV